jgi:hypothetical protein
MNTEELVEFEWESIVASLTGLEESARATGALVRRRVVDSAEMLLRLALVYSVCDHSLRETSAWAESAGVARISDVALLKRFRRCGPWLSQLVLEKIAERSGGRDLVPTDLPVKIVDATHLSRPGSKGSDLRLHVGINLQSLSVAEVQVTGPAGGESLERFTVAPGEVVVADRGYAHRDPMARLHEAGAYFVVRLPWSVVPLLNEQGSAFDLFAFLRSIPLATVAEESVLFRPSDGPPVPCRLVVVRKSAAAAEVSRRRVLTDKSHKHRTIDPRSLEAAEYTILLTNLDPHRVPTSQVAELYRLRWQIEMTFKRFKSLLNFDRLQAHEPALVETYVFGKLLGALLLEDLTDRYLSFFPWGYPLEPRPSL